MKHLYYLLAIILLWLSACTPSGDKQFDPLAPENYENFERSALKDSLKKEYLSKLYYAVPGTNVDSIRAENRKRNYAIKQARKLEVGSRFLSETFANGQLEATWHERGPNNEAGDMREIDFDPATETFYALSTVGHLWKGTLTGQNWTLLRDDIRFETDEIEVLPHNGGHRIFAIYGTGVDDKKVRYSDDEGLSWTTGTGFSFYDHWGKGRRLYTLSDDNTLYYLVHTWSGSPWGELAQLYKSTNKGVSYSKIWSSPTGYSGEDVDLWKPFDSDEMYLIDNRAQNYYKVTHNLTTGNHTITAPVSYASQGVATGGIHVSGRYNNTAGTYELLAIHDSNKNVYKTTNGATWTFLSTASENVWVKGWLADPDNQSLYVGGFQLNKTLNGTTWQTQYPQWWRYYSHSKDSMHVDIMGLDYFEKSNGTPFIIILNHAGVHITYDHFQTTANLGLTTLNAVTLYDQTTASDGFLYCGAQDKGTFKYSGNSLANYSSLATDNMNTGDGMLGVFFNSDQSFYGMIQNGDLYCFKDRHVRSSVSFNIPGTNKPGWINPMVATPEFTDNKAYVAGGNLNGGSGSYLITANVVISGSSVTWNNTQFNYDFRANSNNGTSVIKAIGVSQSDHNRLYVSTEDATFFSSSNQGVSWTKQTTAGLPTTMIPWDIKCSNNNPNKVFICGTGFSNSGVYQSLNGGQSFTALSGSVPAATFYEVSLSDDELLMFAATSEGPYVYVFGESKWYSLQGADTPILDFNTVDNVGGNRIRFGTYGRGIWDLEITNTQLPIELVSFEARSKDDVKSQLDWTTASERNVEVFSVEHGTNGSIFKEIGIVAAKGNSNAMEHYQFVHETPAVGDNYYRLKIRDQNGYFEYSPVEVVRFEKNTAPFVLYPSLLPRNAVLFVQPKYSEKYQIELYSLDGRLVLQQQANGPVEVQVDVPPGVYIYRISSGLLQSRGQLVVY